MNRTDLITRLHSLTRDLSVLTEDAGGERGDPLGQRLAQCWFDLKAIQRDMEEQYQSRLSRKGITVEAPAWYEREWSEAVFGSSHQRLTVAEASAFGWSQYVGDGDWVGEYRVEGFKDCALVSSGDYCRCGNLVYPTVWTACPEDDQPHLVGQIAYGPGSVSNVYCGDACVV